MQKSITKLLDISLVTKSSFQEYIVLFITIKIFLHFPTLQELLQKLFIWVWMEGKYQKIKSMVDVQHSSVDGSKLASNFVRIIQLVDSMSLDSFCVAIYSNPAVATDGNGTPTVSFCLQLEN